MKIDLFDKIASVDTEVDLKIESTIPSKNLFVVFYEKNQTIRLQNNLDSLPYDEFYIRKINHIVQGSTIYQGNSIELQIGFYLSGNLLQPFIISQSLVHNSFVFQNSSLNDDNYLSDHLIFNYTEYLELKELRLENLTFQEFFKNILFRDNDKELNLFYNLHEGKNGFKNLVTTKGFDLFLDESEKTHL